ncbi:MAG: PilZ domain-containing protein [Isosphaeraceae bacterium]|nr:PilZ domain-containing protein [Isosphaeraceae bacterium]
MPNGLATHSLNSKGRRRLRYDRVDPASANSGLGWSLALGLTREATSASPGDRRTEARLEPTGFVCRLGGRRWFSLWQKDVLIINISRGGALVFLDEPPPSGRKLWLELETARRKVIVPADVLQVRRTRLGHAAVRIAFSRRWPYDLFETAVCSLPPVAPRSRRSAGPRGPEGKLPGKPSDA